jgi:hypothetical protein
MRNAEYSRLRPGDHVRIVRGAFADLFVDGMRPHEHEDLLAKHAH